MALLKWLDSTQLNDSTWVIRLDSTSSHLSDSNRPDSSDPTWFDLTRVTRLKWLDSTWVTQLEWLDSTWLDPTRVTRLNLSDSTRLDSSDSTHLKWLDSTSDLTQLEWLDSTRVDLTRPDSSDLTWLNFSDSTRLEWLDSARLKWLDSSDSTRVEWLDSSDSTRVTQLNPCRDSTRVTRPYSILHAPLIPTQNNHASPLGLCGKFPCYITTQFSKLPYLGIKLGKLPVLKRLHIYSFSTPSDRKWAYFVLYGQRFSRYGPIFKIAIFGHETPNSNFLTKILLVTFVMTVTGHC